RYATRSAERADTPCPAVGCAESVALSQAYVLPVAPWPTSHAQAVLPGPTQASPPSAPLHPNSAPVPPRTCRALAVTVGQNAAGSRCRCAWLFTFRLRLVNRCPGNMPFQECKGLVFLFATCLINDGLEAAEAEFNLVLGQECRPGGEDRRLQDGMFG